MSDRVDFNAPDPVEPTESQEQEQPGEKQFRQADGKFSPKQPVQESQREAAQPREPGPIDGTSGELNKRANDKLGVKPPAEAAKAEPPKPQTYKFKSKVDGVEEEEEVDHATLERERQLMKASNKRLQEAAEVKKRAAAVEAAFLKGDVEALKAHGIEFDPDDWAAKRLVEKAQRALIPPEQRELMDAKAKLQEQQQQLDRIAAEKAEAAQKQQDEMLWREMEPKFIAALTQHDIPQDPASLKLMLSVMQEYASNGVDLEPEHAAAEVARRQGARAERYLYKPWKADAKRMVNDLRKNGLLDALRAELDRDYRESNSLHTPKAAPAEPAPRNGAEKKPIFTDSEWKRALNGR